MVTVSFVSVFAFILFQSTKASRELVLRKRDLGITSSCHQLHLEILISPLVEKGKSRQLEIQWEFSPVNNGDWIGLFSSDPLNPVYPNYLPPLLQKIPVTSVHGWANTSVYEHHVEPDYLGYHLFYLIPMPLATTISPSPGLRAMGYLYIRRMKSTPFYFVPPGYMQKKFYTLIGLLQGRCLSYYAAYFDSDNNTLAVTCLRVEPNWMWNLKNEIGPRRLRQVFIPGTHDSAAYSEHSIPSGETLVKKYSITQDETVLAQLIYGVRYIDLRVGYYDRNDEKWWANHGVIRIHPLRTVLRDIKRFLNKTNEIVFLDVQEFPVGFGKNKDVHKKLVSYLEQELGDYAASPTIGWEGTFDQIWGTGKRLIVSYDEREMVTHSRFLWTAVVQKWGNVRTVNDLYTYLAGVIERPPAAAWSAMAELTPSTLDVILDRLKGLRTMAEMVNHDVTAWFRKKTWTPKTNIVAVDFVRGSGIIRSAIEWNKFQGQCQFY